MFSFIGVAMVMVSLETPETNIMIESIATGRHHTGEYPGAHILSTSKRWKRERVRSRGREGML